MSVDTNPPSGDSNKKDLYSINLDKFRIGFMALEEKEPEREDDNDGGSGSNTVVAPTDIGEISSEDIGRVGYVGIKVNPITPEIKKALKDRAEKSKELHDKALEGKEAGDR